MKKTLLFVTVLFVLCSAFALSAFAAEPSTSDEFGETTILDNPALNTRDDYGYKNGDTARVVLQIPNTQTYLTFPMYYCFNVRNDGPSGMQPAPYFDTLNEATGYEFNLDSVIRFETPDTFNAISKNYTKTNQMTNLKYVKCNENFFLIHSSAFSGLTALETVIFEDNFNENAALSISYGAFANCSALSTLRLPIHLTSLGERGISYCNSLTEITIPERLSVIGTAAFLGCNYLENVIFKNPAQITAINHKAFAECFSLNCDFILPNLKDIGSVAFDRAGNNENCYLNVSFPSVVNIGQQAFLSSGIKSLSLSSTFKYDSNAWNTFMSCSKLEYADLSMCTVEAYPACFFANCNSLKVVVLNDNVKTLGKQMFQSCSSLEFLYLPKGIECLGKGDSWSQGAFVYCSSLYFVPEKPSIEDFVTDGVLDMAKYNANKPARPDIYYFPSSIIDLNNVANPFRGCSSINPTIVFASNLTSLHQDGFTFAEIGTKDNPKNVVFLGNVTNFYYNNTYKYINFYFVGSDKDTFTINNKNASNEGGKVYICGESGYYNLHWAGNKADWKETDTPAHIFEKNLSTDATCTMPKMVADYCFCGTIMGEPKTEGVALGHNYTGLVSYAFTTVTQEGEKCTVCVNGCGIDLTEKLEPAYTELGYSVSTVDFAITNGYKVNRDTLKLYEEKNGVKVSLGFAFNAADSFTDGEVTLESFKFCAVIQSSFDYYDVKINFSNDKHVNDNIIMGVYIVEETEENETVSFINRTHGDGVNGFEAVSYNSLLK